MAPFTHLHVASGFSLRYGASTPEALATRAAEIGQSALALTDRGGVYGAIRFVRACAEVGIAPILGVELAVAPSGLLPASSQPARRQTPARGGAWIADQLPRFVALAQGAQGWASLCRLISAAHLVGERGDPVVSIAQVAQHHTGLFFLLGPDSEVGQAVYRRRIDVADQVMGHWREAVDPEQLVIEVVSHRAADTATGGRAGRMPLSAPAAAALLGWAWERRLPTVLSNAVRYADRGGALVTDVLDAVRRLVPLNSRHLDRANAEGYLKAGDQMSQVAEEIVRLAGLGRVEHRRLLSTTFELAQSCELDPGRDLGIGQVFVPELDVIMPARSASIGPRNLQVEHAAAQVVLRDRCVAGLNRRGYGGTDPESRVAQDRLAAELETIATMGFAGYFLTVAEVVDLIREMGVRVAARGSGAGSLVNHALGISGVDPLRHGLLMERFLSPLRRSLPDIDIDVESARRTEIYEQILARFGGERCACVSMMETYRVRHAVRDVGAALGLPPGEVDAFAKSFPHLRAADARAALRDLPELRSSALGRQAARGELDQYLTLVEALDGLPRHIALHPCGVLLSDSTLLDRTPVESSWLGFPMSQFDKDDVEELGLLKLDVLGIRMQSAMAHAVAEISRVDPTAQVDIDEVPLDDPATFELIASTRTLGCFQIESPGQRELIGKFGPETFTDIVIDISLFRPGPVKSDMVNPFLRARQGWTQPNYLHPDLAEVLAETAGVVVFHEQVMQIIAIFTGCSLAQADVTRRTLGSGEGQAEVRGWFYQQALRRKYPLTVVEEVWDVLVAFASFGFCKAHAAAFALPTYQSAWLKAHHPAAFLAGVLTHDPGMYPKRLIVDDARHFGISILPIDCNASDDVYRVEPGPDGLGIRLPFTEVKGISAAEVARLIAHQPYASVADCWHRSGISRPVAESLVVVGAFDALYGISADVQAVRRGHSTRRDLLLQVADLDRFSRSISRTGSRRRKALPLAAMGADPAISAAAQSQAPARPQPVAGSQLILDLGDSPETAGASGLPEMSPGERVRAELDVLGLDVSHHVMDFYADLLAELTAVSAANLLNCRSKANVLVAGMKVATQTPPVRSGKRVVFLTVDDGTGPIDATFFEDAQQSYAETVFHHWLLLVRGEVRRTGRRGVSIRATGAWDLHQVHQVWRQGGSAAVTELLGATPVAVTPAPAQAPRRRALLHASGVATNVYADVRPAGDNVSAGPPSKLWHASPGSSGW